MLTALARPIYHTLYRAGVRAICFWVDHTERAPELPPALLRFRVSESASAKAFVAIGRACQEIIGTRIAENGRVLAAGARILDFGCGCGRTLRWFLHENPTASYFGCDVDREAIAWCREHLTAAAFQVSDALPPLPYAAESFDVIYCLSVFTHLNETMQDAWLAELCRVLKPGGLLILTVHGHNAAMALTPRERLNLETIGFLHRTSRKLKGLVPEWCHTSWHSSAYITARLAKLFDDVSYVVIPDGMQDCVIASRSPSAG